MDDFIPVNEPLLNGKEKEYLCECIDTGWISSEGPFVKRFEEGMCRITQRKYGIAVTNGTAALELAVKALEIGPGDEVIVPTFTIISCAEAITAVGATPVLVDSDPYTWNMKSESVLQRITPRTKAIMIVHIYGLPVDMDDILIIAKEKGIKIIEDAAEMHGQTYKGKPCGSFGDISTFSFYPNKHITTGEGGMLLTDDEELAERCRSLRNLCFQRKKRYVHEELSGNYRFTNLQAAIGCAQLEKIDEIIDKKRKIGAFYTKALTGVDEIQLPLERTDYADNIYWVYGIVLSDGFPMNNEDLQKALSEKGIGSRTFFWCMHEQPVYLRMGLFQNENYPNAERLARRGLYIPSGLALTERQANRVVEVLKQVLKERG